MATQIAKGTPRDDLLELLFQAASQHHRGKVAKGSMRGYSAREELGGVSEYLASFKGDYLNHAEFIQAAGHLLPREGNACLRIAREVLNQIQDEQELQIMMEPYMQLRHDASITAAGVVHKQDPQHGASHTSQPMDKTDNDESELTLEELESSEPATRPRVPVRPTDMKPMSTLVIVTGTIDGAVKLWHIDESFESGRLAGIDTSYMQRALM